HYQHLCNDAATTRIYPPSLHDALPISFITFYLEDELVAPATRGVGQVQCDAVPPRREDDKALRVHHTHAARVPVLAFHEPLPTRSEEHTSELQSRENLVCRLLLEKKNV